MKSNKFRGMLAILLIVGFGMTTIGLSQETKEKSGYDSRDPKYKYDPKEVREERNKYSESNRPVENYLEKFHSQDIAEKLVKQNIEKIYMLKTIISNFPEQDWTKDYKSIYEGYKKGLSFYYKRNMIYSRVVLMKNNKAIKDLFRKMSEKYREVNSQMLDICAETILTVSLNKKTKADPQKNVQFNYNLMRLRVSYAQMHEALRSFTDANYQNSIFHYRMGKAYAIKIMDDLLDEEKMKEYKSFYRKDDLDTFNRLNGEKKKFNLSIHKADNLNRIMSKARGNAPAKKETK